MAIRILIADDHGVLRAGLRALLRAEPDLEVVGEAADGDETLVLALELRPDVVLADISMPGATGIEVARELRVTLPTSHVLILTMHEDAGLLQEAMRVGAAGFVVKRAVETELISAIRAVAEGQTYVHQDMKWAMPPEFASVKVNRADYAALLDPVETNMLRLLARGYTSRQIAEALLIDPQSVESQRIDLIKKLGLRGRVELVRYAKEQGLL